MFVRTFLMAMLRRWYLLIPGLAMSTAMVLLAVDQVPPTYEVEGNIVLLPPKGLLEDGQNPYLAMGGLQQVVDVLVRSLGSETGRQIEARTPGTFTVLPDSSTSGPVILVTATGVSEADAETTLDTVLDEVPPALSRLQGEVNVTEGNQVFSQVLSRDVVATKIVTPTVRAALVAGGGTMIIWSFLIASVDGWLLRRRTTARSPAHSVPKADDDRPRHPDWSGAMDQRASAPGARVAPVESIDDAASEHAGAGDAAARGRPSAP